MKRGGHLLVSRLRKHVESETTPFSFPFLFVSPDYLRVSRPPRTPSFAQVPVIITFRRLFVTPLRRMVRCDIVSREGRRAYQDVCMHVVTTEYPPPLNTRAHTGPRCGTASTFVHLLRRRGSSPLSRDL